MRVPIAPAVSARETTMSHMSIPAFMIPEFMNEIAITAPGGPEVLQSVRVATPKPGPGELLVRVQAAGVNRPDVLQRLGSYPMPPGVTATPGLEVSGTVVACGEGVRSFMLGESVFALTNGGGYAEYCLVPAAQALPRPAALSPAQAAAIPETYFTVWANLFDIGDAKTGDRVLIHGGTSGIGTTALALCREFGIHAFATAGGARKCAAINALGGEAIDYRTQDFVEVIRERTAMRGVDVILDIMGGSYFERNLTALARDGRLVIIGFLGGTAAEKVDLQMLALKRAVVTGSTMRARTLQEKAAITDELRERLLPVLAAGRCLPVIHEVFPLAQAADAHRLMESSEHIGKIVLHVAD